jgi:AraC-like DNA-binding protein
MPIERRTGGPFEHLVEAYWQLPGREGRGERPLEILPDAHFALGFGISDRDCRILVGGPSTRTVQLSLTDARDFFFVRFRAGRLPRLLDLRPADLVDQTELDLPAVLGLSAEAWGERLRPVRSLAARQGMLEEAFSRARLGPLWQDRRCLEAVARIEAAGGRLPVAGLAKALGLSPRSLERLFREQIGLSPKRFARHVRLQQVLVLLRGPRDRSLGRIAQDFGYADQTHFIEDIKALTGRLPGDFRSCRVSQIRTAPEGPASSPGRFP